MLPLTIYFSYRTEKSATQSSGKQSFNIISDFVIRTVKSFILYCSHNAVRSWEKKQMLLKIFLLLNEIIVFGESGLVG